MRDRSEREWKKKQNLEREGQRKYKINRRENNLLNVRERKTARDCLSIEMYNK